MYSASVSVEKRITQESQHTSHTKIRSMSKVSLYSRSRFSQIIGLIIWQILPKVTITILLIIGLINILMLMAYANVSIKITIGIILILYLQCVIILLVNNDLDNSLR